ncbi:MAG: ECF transporter S component [Clostridiales bacterium]|nr:ECF transporter S component [Clostridiales bacterium]
MKSLIDTRSMVIAGILAALTFIVTSFTKIPSFLPNAYYHAGDSIIFLSAMTLGAPMAAFVAGIGSAFSDLYLGYPVFMMATLIIKGVMGYIAGKFMYLPKAKPSYMRMFLGILISGLWMVVGYYTYEVFVLGYDWRAALLDAAANLAQAGVGGAIFLPLSYAATRFKRL